MDFSIFRQLSNSQLANKTAVSDPRGELSYSELDRWSSKVATQIRKRGLSEARTVGLLSSSSIEYVVGLIAIWKAGGTAVPLQTAHPVSELLYILEDADVSLVLVHPDFKNLAGELARNKAFETLEIGPSESELLESIDVIVSPDANALMIYTSGTTRRPKGVPTTFLGLEAQIQSLLKAWRWSSSDRTINVLPLHHVHGVVNVLSCSLAAGASCEMSAKFDPAHVWDRIVKGDINVFMAVPTIYTRLLDHWKSQPEDVRALWSERARALRLMVSGSASLPVPLFEAWENATGHRLLERYGMTEIGMALSNPYDGPRIPGRVGMPLPGVEVRLIDENEAVIEAPNVPGEIQVRGPGVFHGYWRLQEISAESFTADGWFKTGDIAERDENGSYRILGRRSQDIIKSGGYKISALEIESALLEHEAIKEVAVVGVADPEWGERVAAAYVAKEDLREEDCVAFLKGKLARYKVPTLWKRVDSLPRNAMGKVLKPSVRALFNNAPE